jgi:hypothetical protein
VAFYENMSLQLRNFDSDVAEDRRVILMFVDYCWRKMSPTGRVASGLACPPRFP